MNSSDTPDTTERPSSGPQRVAAIICAHNVGYDIALTVRSCRAIPGCDLIVVVDDGSDDDTGHNARRAGAVVVRHSLPRGRASARETGVKVAAMRDRADWPPRLLLFLSADLGESAVEASALVEAVMSGAADCACATPQAEEVHRSSLAEKIARTAIRRSTGWNTRSPLAEERCFTRESLNCVLPFSSGFGLEFGMVIDMLACGMSLVEVPCNFVHTGADTSVGDLNKKHRYADVALAIASHRLRRVRIPSATRRSASKKQRFGSPYPQPAYDRNTNVHQDQE